MFTKQHKAGMIHLCFHVDDILITAPNKELLREYVDMFKEDLNVESHLSSPFSFIGMTLTRDRTRRSIKVTM